MKAPRGFTKTRTSAQYSAICSQPFRVMTRSEFLGVQQRDDEVDEKAGGDDAAEDQVEHGNAHCRSQKYV